MYIVKISLRGWIENCCVCERYVGLVAVESTDLVLVRLMIYSESRKDSLRLLSCLFVAG